MDVKIDTFTVRVVDERWCNKIEQVTKINL